MQLSFGNRVPTFLRKSLQLCLLSVHFFFFFFFFFWLLYCICLSFPLVLVVGGTGWGSVDQFLSSLNYFTSITFFFLGSNVVKLQKQKNRVV